MASHLPPTYATGRSVARSAGASGRADRANASTHFADKDGDVVTNRKFGAYAAKGYVK